MTMPPSGDQPAYIDPITGQPLFVDPATGQLAYTDPTAAQPPAVASTGYTPAPGYTQMPTYPGYVDPAATGVPAAGYTTPAYPQAGYGYGYPMQALQRRTSSMAITAMVLSIAGAPMLFCYGIGGLLGLAGAIVGHIARKQTRERNEDGSGMALAGIIVGWIDFALGIIVIILLVVFIAHINQIDNSDQ